MRILVVEDDLKIASAIKRGLEIKGYAVDSVHDGDEAYSYSRSSQYELIILDRMLPGTMEGLEVLKKLRSEDNHIPVLMLTAKGTIGDKVEGLSSGADDYLVKPFSFDELYARVQAILRRPRARVSEKIKVGDLILDTLNFEARRGGNSIKLTQKEYQLLEFLMRNAKQVVTKEMITNHLWDDQSNILPNTIEVYISSLREKIDRPYEDKVRLINTVRGFGYKLG